MVGLLRVQEWGSLFAQLLVTCSAVKWRTLPSLIPRSVHSSSDFSNRPENEARQSCGTVIQGYSFPANRLFVCDTIEYKQHWLQPYKKIILHSTLAIEIHHQFFHSGSRLYMNFSDSFPLNVQNLDLKDQLCIRWDRRWVKAEHRIGLTSANVHMHCMLSSWLVHESRPAERTIGLTPVYSS